MNKDKIFIADQCDVTSSAVFNEDCMTTMKRYADKFFHLAIVDPPYGIGVGNMAYLKEMNTTVKQKNGTRMNGNKNKKPYTQKQWDNAPPPQAYFDELKRVSQHQIIFGIDYMKWQGIGTGRIKWDKGVAEGMSFNKYEVAYCSKIDDEIELPLLWAGMCQAKSLAEPMTQQGNKKLNEKRIHPCHKPILLYQKLLMMFGEQGQNILDTHLGGGSNRIACHKAGFNFVGSEIDEEYFTKQEARWKNFIAQTTLW